MGLINGKNLWGTSGGREPQRADLWIFDLAPLLAPEKAVQQIISAKTNSPLQIPATEAKVFCTSLDLPELKVNPDVTRRNSRPYNFPGADEPLGAITAKFIVDVGLVASTSEIYRLFDAWRAAVRYGRGSMSDEQMPVSLGPDYRVDYSFDLRVALCKGVKIYDDQVPSYNAMPQEQLEESTVLYLVDTWLSSFKLDSLDMSQGKILTLSATMYADDIQLAVPSPDPGVQVFSQAKEKLRQ